VFEKTERRFFAGQDVAGVVGTIQQTLYAAGMPSHQTGPSNWKARGQVPTWGLVPQVSIYAAPSPQGFYPDVQVSADVEGSGIAVFVVMWLVFFPVAIVLGYMAYSDFTTRIPQIHASIWAPLQHLFVAPNFAPPLAGAGQWGAPGAS
jgi:hypothetical protein